MRTIIKKGAAQSEATMKAKVLILTFLGLVCAANANPQLLAQGRGPLLSKQITGVNAPGPSSVTVNATLDPAFILTGTISSSDPASTPFSVEAASTTSAAIFFSIVDQTAHTYRIVLPAGTYNLNVTFEHNVASQSTVFSYTDSTSPAPFTISGDAIRNATLPTVTTFAVTGTVSNLNALFPDNPNLSFSSKSVPGFSVVSASSPLDGTGSYAVQLPNGSFSAFLSQSMTSGTQPFTFNSDLDTNLGSAMVSGTSTVNFTAPTTPTATLSGAVSVTGTTSLPFGAFLFGDDVSGGTPPQAVSSGDGLLPPTGGYSFTFATNRTYALNPEFSVQLLPSPAPSGDYTPPDPAPASLTGNTTRNVTYPALPGPSTAVTITGKVTITNTITPVANASVSVSGTQITGAPNTSFSNAATTDAFGNYSVVVPAGSNWTMAFNGSFNTSGDFDGDAKADLGVWRPSTGTWYVIRSSAPGTFTATQWGVSGDLPVRGDYDGDGETDIALWRPSSGTWYIIPTSAPTTFTATQWGVSGDIPVPGDYDGDGKTDMAVWRPSTGTWYILPSSMPGTFIAVNWGLSGDIPVPGDYDGDGKTDMAVWRPSTGTWYVIPSSAPTTFTATKWGVSTDMPVPGDYDGDGKTDMAVWRPSTGTWYVIPSSAPTTFTATNWGISGDVPVPLDYDRDRKTDKAVWRPSNGTWYIIPSSAPNTFTSTQWGISTDVPVQKPIGQ